MAASRGDAPSAKRRADLADWTETQGSNQPRLDGFFQQPNSILSTPVVGAPAPLLRDLSHDVLFVVAKAALSNCPVRLAVQRAYWLARLLHGPILQDDAWRPGCERVGVFQPVKGSWQATFAAVTEEVFKLRFDRREELESLAECRFDEGLFESACHHGWTVLLSALLPLRGDDRVAQSGPWEDQPRLEYGLQTAIEMDQPVVVSMLLANKATPLWRHEVGDRLVDWAAGYGRHGVMELLLDANAPLYENSASNALLWAVHGEAPANVDALLQRGADVHCTDDEGRTMLMEACVSHPNLIEPCAAQRLKVVRRLLAADADVNVQDHRTSSTVLMIAASHGDVEIVHALLETDGIDFGAVDNQGRSALDYARLYNERTTMAVLEAAMAGATRSPPSGDLR